MFIKKIICQCLLGQTIQDRRIDWQRDIFPQGIILWFQRYFIWLNFSLLQVAIDHGFSSGWVFARVFISRRSREFLL